MLWTTTNFLNAVADYAIDFVALSFHLILLRKEKKEKKNSISVYSMNMVEYRLTAHACQYGQVYIYDIQYIQPFFLAFETMKKKKQTH